MSKPENSFLLSNVQILNTETGEMDDARHVLVADGVIQELSAKPIAAPNAQRIDLEGMTLMPGLIDCHVHVVAGIASLGGSALFPDSLVTARAARIMHGMLMRGFTTVRDVGGADHGLVAAIEEGSMLGPRLVICGKALSQTGGHADLRGRFDGRDPALLSSRLGALGRVCDGVPEVRRAAREEIKGGADFVKIMANGGVASPTDPIHFLGFARDEIIATVEEAQAAGTYVAAHLYTDEAIRRAVECGVVSVEHGNLVSAATARLMQSKGAFAVPTLVTYEYLEKEGASLGLPAVSIAKIAKVRDGGLASLETFKAAGVPMGFGTDLLGEMHRHQSDEFTIRARVLAASEIIRSATDIAAGICGMTGRIGVIAAGALADLIVVDGDPLADLALLAGQGRHMPVIMKAGKLYKDALSD